LATCADLDARAVALAAHACAELKVQGEAAAAVERIAHLKYEGADTALPIALGDKAAMAADFQAAHLAHFGFQDTSRAIVVARLTVQAAAAHHSETSPPSSAIAPTTAAPIAYASIYAHGDLRDAPVYPRDSLPADFLVEGPALILEQGATTFI